MIVEEDLYLEHYGVKGMKWGVRKDRSKSSGSSKKQKKMSRRERRAEAKRQIIRNREDKVKSLVELAVKNEGNVLIKLNGDTIVTGQEFVQHMVNGGAMNVRTSSVFATTGGKAEAEAIRINALRT